MCFEMTIRKIKPFRIGYKTMRRRTRGYLPTYIFRVSTPKTMRPIKIGEWVDEMPYRLAEDFLSNSPPWKIGWHVFSTLRQARRWVEDGEKIVRVECYGLDEPYGLGVAVNGKPAGRFQFMKILEEVK